MLHSWSYYLLQNVIVICSDSNEYEDLFDNVWKLGTMLQNVQAV